MAKRLLTGRNVSAFLALGLAWSVFDWLTKRYFDGSFALGQVITGPILGLFRFVLVRNTGAAWGMFGGSTLVLGTVSTLVCVFIAIYFAASARQACLGEVIGLALIFAGGLGNALDRFLVGYVVDFVEFTFFSFPVFNIADIGITCGIVIVAASLVYTWQRQRKASGSPSGPSGQEGQGGDGPGV